MNNIADYEKENSENCSICLCEMKDKSSLCQPYNCNHFYHKDCISDWKGDCPLCRKKSLSSSDKPFIKDLIEGFKSLPRDVPSTYTHIYREKWENNICIGHNHNIFFKHTYGIVGICEACQIIQCFGLSHPV